MDWELQEKLRIAEEIERRKEAERSAIRAEIHSCELQRDDIACEIRKLTAKLEEQEAARVKFRQIWCDYEEGRYQYAAMMDRIAMHREHVKLITGHENMIRERVQGGLAQQAVYRMESVEKKMVSEIEKNIDTIETLQRQSAELENRISSLYEQLWRI